MIVELEHGNTLWYFFLKKGLFFSKFINFENFEFIFVILRMLFGVTIPKV